MSSIPPGLFVLEHEPYEERDPLVALVHGTLDRSASFGRVVQRLPDLHVLRYDRRGYGRSAQASPPAASLQDHAADLVAILEGRPAVVVGHSYGGLVALAAACAAPETICAAGVFEAPMPWLPGWPPGSAGHQLVRAFDEGNPDKVVETFMRRVAGAEVWDELPSRTRAARQAEAPALVTDLRSMLGEAPPLDVQAIPCPWIIGSGTESATHQYRGAKVLAGLTGVRLVEISGAGHGAHVSHPEAFSAFVREVVELSRDTRCAR